MIWIAQFCFAAFWLAAGAGGMGLLLQSGPAWIAWLAAGTGCLAFALRKVEVVAPRGLGWGCLLGSVPAFLLPFPWNTPAILLALAGACRVCPPLRRGAVGFGASAILLAVQGGVAALVPLLSSRFHEAGGLAGPLHLLALLAGADSSLHSGRLFVAAAGSVHEYGPLLELSGLWPLLPFVASGLLVARRRWLRFLAFVALFLALRWTLVLALSLDRASVLPFADPAIAIGGLALLAALLARGMPGPAAEVRLEWPAGAAIPWVLGLGAAVLATAAVMYRDPGERKAGRILVDEFHSDWEWSEEKLTKEVYGEKTVYNYFCMVDHLSRFYPDVARNKQPITPDRLSAVDVLVLKTPTRPYSPAEVGAVHDFVRSGGGLWLIGDHTDVLGMNTCLNAVSRGFGIEFLSDSICGLREPWLQPFTPPARGRHPILQDMPPMIFATSCSLRCGPGVWPVIRSEETFGDEIDYGVENFVADMKPSGREAFGSFIQCAATTHGRGRVAAFADSTLFSNFFFHLPGIQDVAMGSVEWLNRRDRRNGFRGVLGGAAILLAAGCVAWGFRRRAFSVAFVPGILSGVALGLLGTDAIARYEPPSPRVSFTTVAFDFEDPGYRMPLTGGTPAFHGDSYHTFFVWMQRMGLVPRLSAKFADCLAAEATILIEPCGQRDVDRLKEYVERGGILVVLDDPANELSTAGDLLKFAGLGFGKKGGEKDFFPVEKSASFPGIHAEAYREVVGGRPVLVEKEGGSALLSVAKIGKGCVAAFGASRLLTVASMGETGTVPDEAQMGLYRLQYWLFEEVLGLRPRSN